MPGTDLVAAIRTDEEDWMLTAVAHERAQQFEAALVCPLQIVEHQHQRRVLGERGDEPGERDLQAIA
jgi:hypothetical protein